MKTAKTNRTLNGAYTVVLDPTGDGYAVFNRLDRYMVDKQFATFQAAWDYAYRLTKGW